MQSRRRISAVDAADAERYEKARILKDYRTTWLQKTKPNLTDCRYQGAARGTKAACADRICCPTFTAAAGKCRRTMYECGIAGIHPDQRTVRRRSMTR